MIAAGSGVGSAAIQIAKATGARVIATAGSEPKLAKAKALGADEVLLHTGDFAREVKRLTGGRGVDVVFEHVGQATWEQSVFSLKPGGRLVTCGATTGFEGENQYRLSFRAPALDSRLVHGTQVGTIIRRSSFSSAACSSP